MFELKPHQEEAVAKMHNGCILCGGVGVGKSHTAVQYYLNNEAPKPVLVITTAKKRDKGDWQDLWAEVGMHKDPKLTMGAVVVVDSWENIKKYEELENAFVIFDEQRLVGTGTWVKAFYKIAAANRWIMLSATPGDNWLDYVPVFRANGFIKNITQFKEEHVLQRWTGRYYQVTGYRQVPKLVRWRNSLLVDMPYDRHTTRHTHEVAVEYDQELVRKLVKERWHVYDERPLTDASELFRVMRKVVYSDKSRLTAVRTLLKSHPKLIVFYNFDYELEILRTLADDGNISAQQAESTSRSQGSFSNVPTAKSSSPESSSTQMSGTSASTKSPTLSGTESTVLDRWGNTHSLTQTLSNGTGESSETGGWDYLLSPEGMRENADLSVGKSRTSSTSSSKTGSGHESLTLSGSEQEMRKNSEIQSRSNGSTSTTSRSIPPSFTQQTTRNNESEKCPANSSDASDESWEENESFEIAEWNGHKHQEIPKTDSWVYLVQYVAGAEAWECVETDAICFWSMPYSYKLWWQSHGRIDRLHTSYTDLHYYVLFSKAVIDKGVKLSLVAKKSFNEAAFVAKTGIWQN